MDCAEENIVLYCKDQRRLRIYITTEKMCQDWGDVNNHILMRARVKSTLCSLKAVAKIYMYADRFGELTGWVRCKRCNLTFVL